MSNKTILIIITLLTSSFSFAQQKYVVKALVTDKADNAQLYADLYVLNNNNIVASSTINKDGWFVTDSLLPGKYTIETQYYYYPTTTVDIEIPVRDYRMEIMMSADNIDSLLANYKLPKNPFYTRYIFGMMTEEGYKNIDKISKISAKYHFKDVNLGCKVLEPLMKRNETIDNLLDYINGQGWREKYQAEIDSLYNN